MSRVRRSAPGRAPGMTLSRQSCSWCRVGGELLLVEPPELTLVTPPELAPAGGSTERGSLSARGSASCSWSSAARPSLGELLWSRPHAQAGCCSAGSTHHRAPTGRPGRAPLNDPEPAELLLVSSRVVPRGHARRAGLLPPWSSPSPRDPPHPSELAPGRARASRRAGQRGESESRGIAVNRAAHGAGARSAAIRRSACVS